MHPPSQLKSHQQSQPHLFPRRKWSTTSWRWRTTQPIFKGHLVTSGVAFRLIESIIISCQPLFPLLICLLVPRSISLKASVSGRLCGLTYTRHSLSLLRSVCLAFLSQSLWMTTSITTSIVVVRHIFLCDRQRIDAVVVTVVVGSMT